MDADPLSRSPWMETLLETDPPGNKPPGGRIPLDAELLWMQTPQAEPPRMQNPPGCRLP